MHIEFPPELPISAAIEQLRNALDSSQVVVVAGETGSGKTTQLPKLCLQLGRGVHGRIGHTQPRRLAARTVAARLAEELQCPLGELVGYQHRFAENCAAHTRLLVMTDGSLLAQLHRDPALRQFDTLIIDEAHERSLNIDFLLGVLKRLLPRRPELKVIITSATIDVQRFASFFGDAPCISVEGRGFPVNVAYLDELDNNAGEQGDKPETAPADLNESLLRALQHIELGVDASTQARDVLVFLPGEREIRDASLALRRSSARLEALPLYARLPIAEQQRIFSVGSHGAARRRVVLATNVAETSLTVPGIGYVVDAGLARISRFSPRSKLQRLQTEPVSKASAAQRAGRAGRLAEGLCIRLYSRED
ncbi:MAG: DEAD/DEAH box helicase, partial [Pseudomonadales bacterium]|nr:DEAD/DEAH box helicase [Pseudomonadales bacterium]